MIIQPQHGAHSRRHFLRGTGACLALPFLETLARADAPPATHRFVCVANPFGMIADAFFPTEAGLGATLATNLSAFDSLRGKFTVFSNLDHGMGEGTAEIARSIPDTGYRGIEVYTPGGCRRLGKSVLNVLGSI
ncbi:MAG: hypothetical protein AB7V57_20695, partial [Verrucomicrobiales bacterium]